MFNHLGPGLLESVYHAALSYELRQRGLHVISQVNVPVVYKNVTLDLGFRLDLLVENQVIVEIKSVEVLHPVHKKQVLTYLKLAKKKVGFLVNFNVDQLQNKNALVRLVK